MTKSADANNQERSNSLHILLSPLGDHFALDDQKPEQKTFSQKEQHVVGYWLCNIIQQPSKQRWTRRDLNCNTRKSTDTTRSPSFSHRCRSEHQRGVMWLASCIVPHAVLKSNCFQFCAASCQNMVYYKMRFVMKMRFDPKVVPSLHF